MGIIAYFRQIKEEVIAEEVAKGLAKAEARGEARGKDEGISEGISRGRQSAIDELRALPTHEVLALLERQDLDPDPNSDPESPSHGNGQSPPA